MPDNRTYTTKDTRMQPLNTLSTEQRYQIELERYRYFRSLGQNQEAATLLCADWSNYTPFDCDIERG